MRLITASAAAALLALPMAASAADDPPPIVKKVLDCRAVADDAQRLACFDASVAALDTARAQGDVAIVDREQVRKTRRGLFGFSLKNIPLFGGGDDDEREEADEVKEINSTVRTAVRNGDGGWTITLEDGARWEQTQAFTFGRNPRPGMKVTIKRGAIGSYKMSFEGGPAVKARRIG